MANLTLEMKNILLVLTIFALILTIFALIIITGGIKETELQPELCSYTDEGKQNECYSNLALNLTHQGYCELITREDLKGMCYIRLSHQTKKPEYCEPIPFQDQKDRCYYSLAQSLKQKKYCDLVNPLTKKLSYSTTTREECYNELASTLASESQNAKYCDWIDDSSDRAYCYYQLAVELEDCNIAPKQKEIDDTDWYSKCLKTLASKKSDPEQCEEIEVQQQKDDCYYKLALELEDPEYCRIIVTDWIMGPCYSHFAESLGDTKYCDLLSNKRSLLPWSKDECYKKVAIALKEPAYCEFIVHSTVKEECLTRFS